MKYIFTGQISRLADLQIRTFLIFAFSLLLFVSCRKEKQDIIRAQPEQAENRQTVEPPSNPDHIKIRVVNRTEPLTSEDVALDDVYGAVTLTYADGTPVSDATTDVPVDEVSEFVEIPYGTYQFRLISAKGSQISAVSQSNSSYNLGGIQYMKPETSTIQIAGRLISNLTYAPILTYQPGGVYTVTVEPADFYYLNSRSVQFQARQNLFMVTKNNTEQANLQYGRIQVVNARSDDRVIFRINGKDFVDNLGYGNGSDYGIIGTGTFTVEAFAEDGIPLAMTETVLYAGQNISVWLWQDKDGQAQLTTVANDLGTEFYNHANEEDASKSRIDSDLPMRIRFLNLCPDEPYISITLDNGADMREDELLLPVVGYQLHSDEAMYNLSPGVVPQSFPYSRWSPYGLYDFRFFVYRSAPGVTPGRWITSIPLLSSRQLIAEPTIYSNANREFPEYEPGVYTVALVGRTINQMDNAMRARLIIVKHNK